MPRQHRSVKMDAYAVNVRDQSSAPLSPSTKQAPPRYGMSRRESDYLPAHGLPLGFPCSTRKMLLTSSATNTPYYDHPRTVRLESAPAFADRDSSQELGPQSCGQGSVATNARLALRQPRPPVGKRLTAFAELPSPPSGLPGMPVRLHRSVNSGRKAPPCSGVFGRVQGYGSDFWHLCRDKSPSRLSSAGTLVARSESNLRASTRRPTPLQDAFHREEPKGQEV